MLQRKSFLQLQSAVGKTTLSHQVGRMRLFYQLAEVGMSSLKSAFNIAKRDN
jgi:hypothetical protein